MMYLKTENINIPIKSDNIELKGSIYYSSRTPLKAPWIFILSGFLVHRGSEFVKASTERFVDAGYYVLSYDYRGHGENTDGVDKFDLYKKTPKIFSDINEVISWVLETQSKRLLEENITLVGWSYGGAIVLTNGFIDHRVRYLVALCARYDYITVQLKISNGLQKSISKRISPKYFLKNDPSNNKRILLAHCKDDKRIPFENVLQIKEHLGLKDENVLIFDKGGHSFEGHRDELFNRIIEFLKN